MKQSRATSFIKSCVSTAVGFAVAFFANMLILPFFGLDISHSANLLLTTIYTVISIARGYVLERAFEAMGWRVRMSAFATAVLAERQRQVTEEGWSLSHDDEHRIGDLARAGGCYAHLAGSQSEPPTFWPWEYEWWKPMGFRRDLVKAAALIVAEGEKFDRNRKSRRASVAPGNPSPRGMGRRADFDWTHAGQVGDAATLAHGKTRSQHAGSSE